MFGSKKAKNKALEIVPEPQLIDGMANFFGVESQGAAKVRGNCCLALGDEQLVSVMWLPQRVTTIPRAAFRSVELTKWHLGKTKGMEMVKLHFVNEAGDDDSVAWIVRDKDAWRQALEDACP